MRGSTQCTPSVHTISAHHQCTPSVHTINTHHQHTPSTQNTKHTGDVVSRMAVVPMGQEARGLDAGSRLAERLVGLGDTRSARIVARIAEEERAHVAVGRWCCVVCSVHLVGVVCMCACGRWCVWCECTCCACACHVMWFTSRLTIVHLTRRLLHGVFFKWSTSPKSIHYMKQV